MSRAHALKALVEVIQDKRPLTHIKAPLTPQTQALVYGSLRFYTRLNAIIQHLQAKPIKKPYVHLALVLGLYELSESEKPAYAIIDETVRLMKGQYAWARGLTNAILRRYDREKASIHEVLSHDDAYIWNTPDWLLTRLQHAYPDDWQAIVKAQDSHPPMSLRVNQQQTSREAYLKQVEATPIPHTDTGLTLNQPIGVDKLPGFHDGMVSVQDGAAQLAAPLLQLEPGLRVLDACSAPGGKLCHILETEPELAYCLALDIDSARIEKIQQNLKRLDLTAEVKQASALKPEDYWGKLPFDRILLDAPCSATGIIRRHPDIKQLRTPEEVSHVVETQQQLLATLWPLLKPGGLLVYATCSILPEENKLQIKAFLETHPDCEVQNQEGMQILPGEDTMDGFFYSVLKKK